MEGTHFLNFYIILIIFLSIGQVECEIYTVGDNDEWSSGTNYMQWAEKYNFSVGDVLVFNYVKGQHNAYEVTEDTYRSCDSSTGVLKKYESGHDQVMLTEERKYWFICNIAGHCLGGMKFGIDVKQGSSTNNTNIAPNSVPGLEQPPPQSSNDGSAQGKGIMTYVLLVFVILHLMNV